MFGPGNVNVIQLFRIQPIHPFDLRNDLVAQAFHVEPVDVIAADAGGEIGADLLHVESHRRDLVVIENDLRLRLVDLGVDVAKLKHVRLHRFLENAAWRIPECVPGLAVEAMMKLTGKLSEPGSASGMIGNI